MTSKRGSCAAVPPSRPGLSEEVPDPKRRKSSILHYLRPQTSADAPAWRPKESDSAPGSPAIDLLPAITPAAARLPLHLPDTVMASATGCATRLGPRVAEETLASLQRRFVTAQTLATPRLGAPVLTLDLGRLPAAGADLSPGGESGSEGEESEDGFTLHSQPAYERSLSQAHCAPGPPSCRTPSDEGGSTRFSFGCTQDAPMPLSAPGQGPAPEAAAGNTPLLDLAAPIGCVSDSTQKLFPIFKPKKDYKHLYIVRHGESEYNAATAAAGTGWDDPLIFDAPLTARGRAQACELRNTLAALGLPANACWVTSPLQRAIETLVLACTGKERGVGGEVRLPSSLHIRSEIREKLVTAGDVGQPASVLKLQYPEVAAQLDELPDVWWHCPRDKPNCTITRAFQSREKQAAVQKRIAAFKRWLYDRPETVIVAFGHSSFWKHFCAGYCGVKPERMYNCEVRHLQL
ncbi:hypothetical protein APUTEX25_002050 [Auxenochlorella protothecoides]|uniref:Uncharacterized protein n=1 Tax=Auxenochlorella protothecoides TaxID=3075 RepID=A0A3M7KX79_AUXPR|nr:hypothetical protein APUTEX25_002050 [Auxenochlorella protothecoides]|eukprot:RMZ54474.1 hypothetical protein APUTEX25_002050 [Auxenochlorella protothecoides]